jgi:hypothetical protein
VLLLSTGLRLRSHRSWWPCKLHTI